MSVSPHLSAMLVLYWILSQTGCSHVETPAVRAAESWCGLKEFVFFQKLWQSKLVKNLHAGTLRPRALFWISYLLMGTMVPLPHTHSQLCPLVGVQLMGFHDNLTRQEPLSASVLLCLCSSFSLSSVHPTPAPPNSYQTLKQSTNWSREGTLWPVTVPSGKAYPDGPGARSSPWELEPSFMDSPTNYRHNWREGSSPSTKGSVLPHAIKKQAPLNH